MNTLFAQSRITASRSRGLWAMVILGWMLIGFASLNHQAEHGLASDLQCQFCQSNSQNTPFIGNSLLALEPFTQTHFVVATAQIQVKSNQPLSLLNRGPPLFKS